MNKVVMVFVALFLLIGASSIAQTVPVADEFQMPFNGNPSQACEFGVYGECLYNNKWHLAEDYGMSVGTPIYACADGIVREVRHSADDDGYGYGGIVLIEHELTSGESIVSICAHLNDALRPVSVNQEVFRGNTIIGYVGAYAENGHVTSHVHFGIHKNSYASTPTYNCNGSPNWAYQGYSIDECAVDDWYDPSDFIENHSGTPPVVGCFAEGDCGSDISRAFQAKYDALQPDHPLGNPWQNTDDGSIYVHEVNGMLIQDFRDLRDEDGPSNGYYHPYTALIYDATTISTPHVRLLKEGFWDTWMNHVGWVNFGPPILDEGPNSGETWQTFRRYGFDYPENSSDYENFYFTWNSNTQILEVLDKNYNPVDLSKLTVKTNEPLVKVFKSASLSGPDLLKSYKMKGDEESRGNDPGGDIIESGITILVNGQVATATSPKPNGVYHSGLFVSDFDEPFDLVNQRDYDNFYAIVNGDVIPIDPFTINGDMVIYIDDPPPEGEIQFSHWTIYPNPGTVGEQIHVEGEIYNVGGSAIILSELRVELLNPNGVEVSHYSMYNVTLESGDGWYQWMYCYPSIAGNHTARFRGLLNGQWQTYATQTIYIQNNPNEPVAAFTGSPLLGDAPLTVQFTDQSTGNPNLWQWVFGDGYVSHDIQHPEHTFVNPGVYTIDLLVHNEFGADRLVKNNLITVTDPPDPVVADFIADVTFGPAPLTVQFTDQSGGNPTSWVWDFGDGNTSTEQNPSHVFDQPGDYSVILIASNETSSDDFTGNIHVNAYLDADFTVNTTVGYAPIVVRFTDQSTGNPTSWYWDFGDGSHATIQNPSPTYWVPGIYSVKLRVQNSQGVDSVLKVDYINIVGSTYQVNAEFSADTTIGSAPLTVQFTDESSGYPSFWYWDFGDSVTSTEQNPVHTYVSNGIYTVSLTVGNISNMDSTLSVGYIIVDDMQDCIVSIAQTPGYAKEVFVSGNYAYVADWMSLQIIDISDPQTLMIVGEVNLSGASDVVVSGNYAYVADWIGDLRIIDISDPEVPVLIRSLDIPGEARGLTISGNYVYIADGSIGMQIIDISDPLNPELVSSIESPYYSINVEVLGSYAYLMDQRSGVRIIDISNPASPVTLCVVNTPGAAEDIVFRDDLAYVADHLSGMCILDISNPATASIIGSVSTAGRVEDIAIIDDIVYLADFTNDIQIVDVSDPTEPVIIGSIEVIGQTTDVFIHGDYLYIGAMSGGIVIANKNCGFVKTQSTVLEDSTETEELVFGLLPNHPNPFNPKTTISYSLPTSQQVSLVVYNILGQTVTTLVNGVKGAGVHTAEWSGHNDQGQAVSSGIYFYRLTTAENAVTRKMLLLK